MALMNQERPYIHSNYANFTGIYNMSLNTKGVDLLQQKIDQLKSIANKLYEAAANFLGVSTEELQSLSRMKEISNQLLGLDNRYSEVALQILNSREFINLLIKRQTYSLKGLLKLKNLPDTIKEVLKSNSKELLDPTIKQLANAIIDTLPDSVYVDSKGGSTEKKVDVKKIETYGLETTVFNNAVVKVLKKDGARLEELIIKSIQESSVFKNLEKEKQNNYSQEAEEYFRNTYLQNFSQDIDQNSAKNYLEKIIKALRNNGVFNLTENNRAHVQGKLGEAGIAAQIETVNENKEAKIKVRVVGAMKERDVMEKIFNQKISQVTRFITHDISKQSYSDLVLERNGRMVRVQSKNYLGIVNNWIQANGENRIASITTDSNSKNVIEFLQKAQEQNAIGTVNLDAIAYVLANEMWFKSHASYGGGVKNTGRKQMKLNFDFDKINRALSEVLYNFIGVVVDESIITPNIIAEQSNLFYILSNGVMVPTGLLVDGIAKSLALKKEEEKEKEYGPMNLNIGLRLDSNGNIKNADTFYKAKLTVIRGSKDTARYTNEDLLKIGQDQGSEIISSLKIDAAKVRFSLNDILTTSAYAIGL